MTTAITTVEPTLQADFQVRQIVRNAGNWCRTCDVGWSGTGPCWNCGGAA